jgi:hypothetical protein
MKKGLLLLEFLLEKICNFNKSAEETLMSYRYKILSELEKKLDQYEIRNESRNHPQNGKYLKIFHNQSTKDVLCEVLILENKTFRIVFANLSLIPSEFKYKGLSYNEEIIEKIITTLSVIENKTESI